jgi:hypothetical protein
LNKPLHIVCLDAPAPPDYGGAIDMYCKIKALAEAGAAITLHYFDYKKERGAGDLESVCYQVFRYERGSFLQRLTFSKPHIIASRVNAQLIDRLNADAHPVLLEGIHCTGIIPHLKNPDRKIVVRLHNDEAVYYNRLAHAEPNFFKRAYYAIESQLLKGYQKKLPKSASYAALSQNDADHFASAYKLPIVFVPAFVPWQHVTSRTGIGNYCLYHGNLAVAENEAAAVWLIEKVFSNMDLPLVIAGRKPSKRLIKAGAPFQNIRFRPDPTEAELTALIQQAHVHVLPDFNSTGMKLKLLHALFEGRYCITNNTGLQPGKTLAVAQTPEQYMRVLKSWHNQPFTEDAVAERKKLLCHYNNQENAALLTGRLW